MKHLFHPRTAKALFFLILLTGLTQGAKSNAQKIDFEDMFGISAGGGYTFSHTDFEWTKTVPSPVFCVGIHYFSLEFLSLNLEFQKGLLKGGASLDAADKQETGFENNYFAGCLTFRFFPVQLASNDAELDGVLKALSTFYGGTGVGLIYNNVDANNIPNAVYGVTQNLSTNNVFVPLELGVNIPIARIGKASKLLVNVNLRTNLCFSDDIDGYQPTLDANEHNDAFTTLTGGLVYKFGL